MKMCWDASPKARPSFSDLVQMLTPEGYGEGALSHPTTPVWLRGEPSTFSSASESGIVPPHIAAMKPVS